MESSPVTQVVAIGASAGGLDALERFFVEIPRKTGLAFVVIQHLSPDFKSIMDDLLARRTPLAIEHAVEGMALEPDTIYLTPPKTRLGIADGKFMTEESRAANTVAYPIDDFFASLATDMGEKTIGVVLSGTGTDGSRGVMRVREAGGSVYIQSAESAKFDGMPRAAMASGAANFIGSPEEIARRVAFGEAVGAAGAPPAVEETPLEALVAIMRRASGVDFSMYKPSTVERRLERRLNARKCNSLADYVEILREDGPERDTLLQDLLIEVTRFHRDPGAFAAVREKVAPMLSSGMPEFRIWVAGCATGEEAYTWAMLLLEETRDLPNPPLLKVFATDIHRGSLETAASGNYPAEALEDLPEQWRASYFDRLHDRYQVTPALRSHVVFAEHNLLKDPPFTRVQVVSCRNLLIYLKVPAQEQILANFHFALTPGGMLFLGPSETLGTLQNEFETLDAHWRLYGKPRTPSRSIPRHFGLSTLTPREVPTVPGRGIAFRLASLRRTLYDKLLDSYVPPGFVVSHEGVLLHTFGDAGRYLSVRGPASQDLFSMMEGELRMAASMAVQRAHRSGERTCYGRVPAPGDPGTLLTLTVDPIVTNNGGESAYHLAIVTEASPPPAADAPPEAPDEFLPTEAVRSRIADLENQLLEARENLQATIEELETSNEELQAANEELLASNEELQSTNEELQSVNEELYTVNAEYEKRNEELLQANRDLTNLMDCTDIGTLFLDGNLRIRKFTPMVRRFFRLQEGDLGRPLEDIASRMVAGHQVLADARKVLAGTTLIEREVEDLEGTPLLQRVTPYRLERGSTGGVVVTFVDLTQLRKAKDDLLAVQKLQRAIIDGIEANMAVLDQGGTIIAVNSAWEEFGKRNDASSMGRIGVGTNYFSACVAASTGKDRTDASRALAGIRDVLMGRSATFQMQYPCHAPGEHRWFLMRVTPLDRPEGGAVVLHLNVTDLHRARTQLDQLSSAIANSSTAIVVTNPDAIVQQVNSAYLQMTGYEEHEVVGQNINVVRSGRHTPEFYQRFWKEIKSGRIWNGRFINRRKDGTFYTSECTVSPVRDEHSRVKAYLAMARDVTGTERLEELVEQTHRLETIGQLAGGVAHDFNNLLTPILGYAEMIAGGDPKDERTQQGRDILECANRAKALTQQLLTFSRKQPLRLEDFDLNSLVRNAQPMLRRLLRENVRIDVEMARDPLPVTADARQLEQALFNLALNAQDALGQGGCITLRTGILTVTQQEAALTHGLIEGTYAVLTVEDDGPGIPPDILPHVFEPFYTTKDKSKGTGLGLATVYGIARKHHGTIYARNRAEGGAAFSLCLPLNPAAMHEDDGDKTGSRDAGGRGETLWIVEDDPGVGRLAAAVLSSRNYHVRLFASAPLALKAAERESHIDPPQLLLSDVIMPEMNGAQLADALRHTLGHELRVVFMSGYPAEALRKDGLLRPGDVLVWKPFERHDLLKAVRTALDQKSLHDVSG